MERASQSCDRQEESPKVFLPFQDLHFRRKVKIWFQWAHWAASGPWMWKLIALSLDSLNNFWEIFIQESLNLMHTSRENDGMKGSSKHARR